MKRTVSIVGAGRVGRTLGKLLRGRGWRIGVVVTRSKRTWRAAVRAIGGGRGQDKLSQEVFEADIVLVTTPDDAIAPTAAALARVGGAACRGKIFLHTSGALGRDVLKPLARMGGSTGSLHPMQTFSGRNVPRLQGAIFAVEGDARARRAAKEIARLLGGVPIQIDSAGKPAYHAAGALVAGHALGLVEAGTEILIGLGFPRRRALQTLLPLMRQMLDNFERLGARAAWTGPLARGDYAVVARHIKALRRYPAEFCEAYKALARLAVRVLGAPSGAQIREMERALKQGGTN